MEDAKGAIIFLGHLEKDLQPHQQSPLEKFSSSADHGCGKMPVMAVQLSLCTCKMHG